MRLPTFLIAAGFGLFEAAAGVILPNNAVIAGVLAAGGVGCVVLAVYLDKRKTATLAPKSQEATVTELSPSWIRELTDDEKVVLVGITQEVLDNHGHSDQWGIHRDILQGGRLSDGLCKCGRPRNEFIPFEERGKEHKNE